jgi:RNA 2',3'-cyclic 3'-phosphodiesterase
VRLFVALEIPPEIRANLASEIKQLRALEPPSSKQTKQKMRWVRPENLHVTLKFIGEAAPEKLDAIQTTLSAVRPAQPVEVRFKGLGFFPNEKRARVLFVSVEASPNLAILASEVDKHLEKLGFFRETREFTPHLTLARIDPPGIRRELQSAVQKDARREFGVLRAGAFHLIESKLKPSGAEYTTLRSFPFAAEA